MTSPLSKQFRWSDAWLLESISIACEAAGAPAPLAEVLQAADGVNKTPIFFEELNGGASRLERSGYVTLHEDMSFSITPAGVTLLEEAGATAFREHVSVREAVERMLGALPWTRDDDPRTAGDNCELISQEAIQAAEKAYRKKLRKEMRKTS